MFYSEPVEANPVDQMASLNDLVKDLDAGAVDILLILGGNPAFNSPVELGMRDRLKKAKLRVRLGLYADRVHRPHCRPHHDPSCRSWARAIFTTWPDLDGLLVTSTMTGRVNTVLWNAAEIPSRQHRSSAALSTIRSCGRSCKQRPVRSTTACADVFDRTLRSRTRRRGTNWSSRLPKPGWLRSLSVQCNTSARMICGRRSGEGAEFVMGTSIMSSASRDVAGEPCASCYSCRRSTASVSARGRNFAYVGIT